MDLTPAEQADLLEATHFSHKTCEHLAPTVAKIVANRVREAKAQAWHEGYQRGRDALSQMNPYRD